VDPHASFIEARRRTEIKNDISLIKQDVDEYDALMESTGIKPRQARALWRALEKLQIEAKAKEAVVIHVEISGGVISAADVSAAAVRGKLHIKHKK
jgi:hypothetical protein